MNHPTAIVDVNKRSVPLSRLVRVETRKMVNTRSGRWLILAVGLVTMMIVAAMTALGIGYDEPIELQYFFAGTSWALAMLVPLLGIMTVTSEWGQRTSLTTFVLEPRRGRVIAAKFLAGLSVSIISLAVVAGLSFAAYGLQMGALGDQPAWSLDISFIAGWALGLLAGFCLGFAFGMLVPNTAAAIVLFFVFRYIISNAMEILSFVWEPFADVLPWIDLSRALDQLTGGATMDTADWLHLASASWWWILLPLGLGSFLLLRREVK